MRQSRGNEPLTHLARMIDPAAPGSRPTPSPTSPPSGGPPGERSLWQRLNMEQVARRVKPMAMRLYLYHVIDGHDVATTVLHIADPKVTSESVHLAKHRVQRLLDETLERLRQGAVVSG